MAKSSKKKKATFQKVKLKLGRKIKKGGNFTNTAFKTKKIQIRGQMKATSQTPVTKRNLNLQDLLLRLKHYNISVRHEALIGLKELLAENQQIIHDNLTSLIEKIIDVIADKEEVVRRSALAVLKQIMSFISVKNISGLYPLLKAHLSCALTHISDNVRSDSLVLLDIIIEYHPQLVKESSNVILPSLLDLISGQQTGNNTNDFSKSRVLNINPSSKMSQWNWRIQLLNRLEKCLYILYTQEKLEDDVTLEIHWTQFYNSDIHKKCNSGFYPYRGIINSSIFRSRNNLDISQENSNKESDKKFIKTIIPLLFGWWVEASPDLGTINLSRNDLSSQSVAIMNSILGIFLPLIRNLTSLQNREENILWFKDNFFKDLLKYVATSFPYTELEEQSKIKGNKKNKILTQNSCSCLALNIRICEIMILFFNKDICESWEVKIFHYLTMILKKTLSTNNTSTVVGIIEQLINLQVKKESLDEILSALHTKFILLNNASQDKYLVLSFFAKQLESSKNFSELINLKSINQWLRSLPIYLVQAISQNKHTNMSIKILNILLLISPLKNSELIMALQEQIPTLFELLPQISMKIQEKLIMVFVSSFFEDKAILKKLVDCSPTLNPKIQAYLEDLLIFRYGHNYTTLLENDQPLPSCSEVETHFYSLMDF